MSAPGIRVTKQHLIHLFGDDSTVMPHEAEVMDALDIACQAMHSIAGDLEVLASASKDSDLPREQLSIAIRGVARRLEAVGTIAFEFGELAEESGPS